SDGIRRVDHRAPGGNFAIDPQGCAAAIYAALQVLAEKADLSLRELWTLPTYAGVAGVVRSSDAEKLRRILPFDHLQVEDDRRAMIMGALDGRDGYVAALGTGSFFVRSVGDDIAAIGGWGLTLGDEASGAWLGRQALRMALWAHDGLDPMTEMAQTILDEMGGAEGVVDFARSARPEEFARIAPSICALAEAHDTGAQALMTRGAHWIERALTALGWAPGQWVCLTGGIGESYKPYLPDAVSQDLRKPVGTALDGALVLAQTMVRLGIPA
ncbi:MAG: BadF/BadG/BcrA/BcrD ATPase family protein, partial [Paracoccaceae bacterium]